MQWGLRIPLHDGKCLNAILYLPDEHPARAPTIVTMTPYIAQTYHDRGMYFAAHGYPFLIVDVRGRGNSEGEFRPLLNEAADGYDVVEWVAQQPFCDGQVAMWGGSYGGYVQWATAGRAPPHLRTIVPVAAPFPGVDFPGPGNLPTPYLMQWLTLVWGRTGQDKLFWNNREYWSSMAREHFEAGAALSSWDARLGHSSAIFQEWLAHPDQGEYWDGYNPSARRYAALSLPILTITGIYDGDQAGALMHHRQHLANVGAAERARHYLIIGPWDHSGTRTPAAAFCGLKVGAASLLDLGSLHREWYAWTMQGAPKPQFLRRNVAYYLMGADEWRYADTLESVTARSLPLYLDSNGSAGDVCRSGSLQSQARTGSAADRYSYDPRDVSGAELECSVRPEDMADSRTMNALVGKQLYYHAEPFERDTDICGFFRLVAWLSIDQPDTDFRASVHEVCLDGSVIQLTSDSLRARYRENLREPKLIRSDAALRYELDRFTFVARRVLAGHRLRLVFGPVNSIYAQKNYNSGGDVAHETMADARTVTVRLWHGVERPSVLYVPLGAGDTPG